MSTFSPNNVHNPAAPVSTNHPAESTTQTIQKSSELTGRILLSALFLISGLGKLGAYTGTLWVLLHRARGDLDVDAGQMGLIAEYIKGARADRR